MSKHNSQIYLETKQLALSKCSNEMLAESVALHAMTEQPFDPLESERKSAEDHAELARLMGGIPQ